MKRQFALLGALVCPKQDYYEESGVQGGQLPATSNSVNRVQQDGRELVQAVRELPSLEFIGWDNNDTAELEQRLGDREADHQRGQIS